MIVIGDISGIHDFVFAVPQTGGGQARRLRARSFLLQAAAECAALAVQRKLDWPDESLLFAAASKFALQGPDDPQAEQSLIALRSEIQKALFDKALARRAENTRRVDSWDQFKEVLESEGGFLYAHWDGTDETEAAIQEETKATIRCIPLDDDLEDGVCVRSGKPSKRRVIFAKAY